MVLATAKIGDFDRFWNTFSTKGAEKRKQHGCKGAHVFRSVGCARVLSPEALLASASRPLPPVNHSRRGRRTMTDVGYPAST